VKPTLPPFIWLSLVVSYVAACFIWRRILTRDCAWHVKLAHFLFVAVPIIGPMLYIFLAPPTVHPPERQMPQFPKGTKVYGSFTPLIECFSCIFWSNGNDKKGRKK